MTGQSIPSDIQQELLESDDPPWPSLKEHPLFSPKWVTFFLKRQRAIPPKQLEDIVNDAELVRHYAIILALVKNRTFPQTYFMRFAETLRWSDILTCLRLTHISQSSKTALMANLMQRYPFFTLGEKIAIARKAPRILINHLRNEHDPKILEVLINNTHFTHTDAAFLATSSSQPRVLGLLASMPKWTRFKDIRMTLLRNTSTPNAYYRNLLEGFSSSSLITIQRDPSIPRFAKVLAKKLQKSCR